MDYNLKEKSGRELFNFLSEPSITVGHFQSDGVDSVVRPCREFLRPSLSNKTDVIFEEMNRRYERERWLNLDELTQMHCLPFITNAFAAVTDGAPSNSIILKYTNQIVSINIIYDWQRDIVSSLTSTLTNGATIEYSYGAFKETSLGIFPYLMRYGTPRRAFHTREFRISKLSFNSPWKAEIASFNIPYGTTVADARFTPELTYQQGKHQYKDEELIQLAADSKAGKIVKMGIAAEAPMPLKDIQRKQRPILFYALITVILLSPFAVFIVRRRFA
jgi:hypothetical protein